MIIAWQEINITETEKITNTFIRYVKDIRILLLKKSEQKEIIEFYIKHCKHCKIFYENMFKSDRCKYSDYRKDGTCPYYEKQPIAQKKRKPLNKSKRLKICI